MAQDSKMTHAQLAAQLLRDAANFFRHLAQENPTLQEQMQDNAEIYDEVAGLVEKNPNDIIELEDPN
jgi:hypothetical protein